jgi:phosphoribosylformylglycinamidine cyclo-ligase
VGGDLVNHCVNDILACGATPRFFLDYVAMGGSTPRRSRGWSAGWRTLRRERRGDDRRGERRDAGLYADGEYDAAGFIVGTSRRAGCGRRAVRAGDACDRPAERRAPDERVLLARALVGLTGEHAADRETLSGPLPGGDAA